MQFKVTLPYSSIHLFIHALPSRTHFNTADSSGATMLSLCYWENKRHAIRHAGPNIITHLCIDNKVNTHYLPKDRDDPRFDNNTCRFQSALAATCQLCNMPGLTSLSHVLVNAGGSCCTHLYRNVCYLRGDNPPCVLYFHLVAK